MNEKHDPLKVAQLEKELFGSTTEEGEKLIKEEQVRIAKAKEQEEMAKIIEPYLAWTGRGMPPKKKPSCPTMEISYSMGRPGPQPLGNFQDSLALGIKIRNKRQKELNKRTKDLEE